MRVINLLQTWSVGGSLIVFGLWFQSCNTESLGNPVTPGTLPLLDNSTTVDNCSAYSDNALKPLSIRGEGKHEWESDIGSFVEGVLKDDHSLVDEKTTLYKGNNDPNDNYGHAIGWERNKRNKEKRLTGEKLKHMAPVLQKLRQHHQNATPLAQLPAAEQSILNLFRVVYGSGPAVQELDRIEKRKSSLVPIEL
ncbi:hypothetical protein AFLA70_89g003260 [Aspergillus flavus AF70]|nr:hypothetical protein AFLA70_89g003260 [Aspergillus flavus AF70]